MIEAVGSGAPGVTRRRLFRIVGAGLVTTFAWRRAAEAQAQGNLAALGPEETVDATLKRLFAGRPMKDGSSAIKIDLPLIAENGAVVPVSIEVDAPMTPQRYVKSIYIVSDRNRRPLNAKFNLTPAAGQAFVGTNLRLGESTDVRAIAELSDGTLLQARREVKVTVGGCGG